MKKISTDQIITLHRKIIKKTGGSLEIRDLGLIESSLNQAFLTFDGNDLYETTIQKIAITTYLLIKNHGFVDGNKRIGVTTMLLLLELNGITVHYTQKELVELGLKVARGEWDEKDILKWITKHS